MNVYLKKPSLLVLLFALVVAPGCNKKTLVKDFDEKSDAPNVKRGVKPIPDAEVAVIETADYGTIVVELYPNIAPQMVQRFKRLAQEGFYNGTTFHRVNSESGLVQGGDPLSKDNDPLNDGSGDSPYPNVPGEFSDIPFERGSLGAARRGATPEEVAGPGSLTEEQARDTANCQFFITTKPAPDFDGEYTLFGKVIEGMSNVDVIAGAPVQEETEHPAENIVIKSISLQPGSKFVRNDK